MSALAKDGRLKLSEAQVEQSALELAAHYGYFAIRTNASTLTRAGYCAFRPGYADWYFAHPQTVGFFAEFKARKARTNRTRAQKQAEFQAEMQAKGFRAYRAKDGDPDPIGSFTAFLEARGMVSALKEMA